MRGCVAPLQPRLLFATRYFGSQALLRVCQLDYAKEYANGLVIRYNTEVEQISQTGLMTETGHERDHEFVLKVRNRGKQKYKRCSYLFSSVGLTKPYVPKIEGIELAVGYEDVSIQPQDFDNKTVLILGKKQSAFETAKAIYGSTAEVYLMSPNRVRLSWESHYVGDVRAINAELVDAYQLKSLDGAQFPLKILKEKCLLSVSGCWQRCWTLIWRRGKGRGWSVERMARSSSVVVRVRRKSLHGSTLLRTKDRPWSTTATKMVSTTTPSRHMSCHVVQCLQCL